MDQDSSSSHTHKKRKRCLTRDDDDGRTRRGAVDVDDALDGRGGRVVVRDVLLGQLGGVWRVGPGGRFGGFGVGFGGFGEVGGFGGPAVLVRLARLVGMTGLVARRGLLLAAAKGDGHIGERRRLLRQRCLGRRRSFRPFAFAENG